MSNERFDKRIKQQLESVKPPYQARAWDRFRKRVPAVGFWPWLGQYGGWLLSGLMLSGWLTTLYMLHQNQQAIAQLSQTLALPAQVNRATPLAATATSALVNRVDTVFMVKRTIVEHRHYYTPLANPVALDRQPELPDSLVGFAGGPDESLHQPTRRSRLTGTRPDSKQSESLSTNGRPFKPIKTGSDKMVASRSGLSTAVESNRATREPLTNVNESQYAAKQLPARTESLNRQPLQPDAVSQSASHLDSVTHNPTKGLDQPKDPLQPAKQRHPPFRFSSLKPRVGIETMAAHHGIGAGPSIELFPGENFGLSLGLQASQLHAENHRGLTEFNAATGQEFIHQYRPFLPIQYDKIEDISIQTAIISLPVSLKYYVSLHRNWSLLVQAGTNFDVAGYQQVRFESVYQGDEQHNSFEVKAEHRLFHNFLFGTGLQYRSSRISAQLTPYYLYDFRPILNTPAGNNFGGKVSVWLDLIK